MRKLTRNCCNEINYFPIIIYIKTIINSIKIVSQTSTPSQHNSQIQSHITLALCLPFSSTPVLYKV